MAVIYLTKLQNLINRPVMNCSMSSFPYFYFSNYILFDFRKYHMCVCMVYVLITQTYPRANSMCWNLTVRRSLSVFRNIYEVRITSKVRMHCGPCEDILMAVLTADQIVCTNDPSMHISDPDSKTRLSCMVWMVQKYRAWAM